MSFKILHLIASLSAGGAEHQLSYLVREQSLRGYEIVVAHLLENDDPELWGDTQPCLYHINAAGNYDPRIIAKTIKLIRHFKPDIIHSWILPMDIVGGIAARFTNTPWMVRESTSMGNYEYADWPSRIKRWLQKNILSMASLIVSNSNSGNDYWASVYPEKRRCIIRNALPLEKIRRASPITSDQTGIPQGKDFILSAGRLENWPKNLYRLFEAFREVVRITKVDVVICGEGADRKRLEQIALDSGFADRFHFTGYVNNVWQYMKAAKLFCSVSLVEGQPNTVLEAMASRCPLVVSDIPAHREFIQPDMAYFVNPENPVEIQENILAALSNESEANLKALNSYNFAKSLDVSTMADAYENAYECMLKPGSILTFKIS
jgi:glycosyltransferase involved in cell wall biosynthesis